MRFGPPFGYGAASPARLSRRTPKAARTHDFIVPKGLSVRADISVCDNPSK